MMRLLRRKVLRPVAAGLALFVLGGAAGGFSAAEWQTLERETARLATAAGAASGRAAACHRGDAAARRQAFYDFLLRYLAADAASARLEAFDRAADAARHAPCDRYLLQRDRFRAREARRRIEPILRDHHF